MHIPIHKFTYICVYLHIYIRMFIDIYIYVCIYYTHTQKHSPSQRCKCMISISSSSMLMNSYLHTNTRKGLPQQCGLQSQAESHLLQKATKQAPPACTCSVIAAAESELEPGPIGFSERLTERKRERERDRYSIYIHI